MSSLFPTDAGRSAYAEPQRHLLLATFKGLQNADRQFAYRSSDGAKHNWFTIHAEFGETFFGPYLHKDVGASWAFIGFAKPGSPWIKSFRSVTDTQSARDVVVDLFATYFPEDAALIEQLQPLHEDPHSWFLGAVTPTVRRAVATTAKGHPGSRYRRCGDLVRSDRRPGSANRRHSGRLACARAQKPRGQDHFEWLQDQFEKHWNNRGDAATEVTRLFLGDPKYATHAELLFPAAAVNVDIGTAFLGLLSEPRPLLGLQSREDVVKFISDLAGEPAENLLARFKSPQQFRRVARSR